MFKSLKEKIRPSQFAEKLGHISEIDKSDNSEVAVILRPSDVQTAKKYILADCVNNKPKATLYLKSGKRKKHWNIPFTFKEIAKELSGKCIFETFNSSRKLYSLIRGKNFGRIFIFYAENIDRPNFFFEIAAFRGKSAEVIGVDKSNNAYRLQKKYYRYKFYYTILKDMFAGSILLTLRVSIFALLFLALTPFVALFWMIMLALMIFNSADKKEIN